TIFEQQFHSLFTPIPSITAAFHCRQYALVPSTAFFLSLATRPNISTTLHGAVELSHGDFTSYDILANAQTQITNTAKGFRKRDH
ncbi:hypothetical protein BDN67DRAFT_973159, partial [Paxillus ammoniavirescens]